MSQLSKRSVIATERAAPPVSDLATLTADLPPEQRIAVSYARLTDRVRYAALFALDRQLAQALIRSREPLAAQLRLAWWRDLLDGSGTPVSDRLVAAILAQWRDDSAPAIAMVDGWEELVAEEPDVTAFAAGRAAPFVALARGFACRPEGLEATRIAAQRWSLIDLAQHSSNLDQRQEALAVAESLPPAALPRVMRPLAVLDGLASRALARNASLFGDRLSPLVAIRLGIFGR